MDDFPLFDRFKRKFYLFLEGPLLESGFLLVTNFPFWIVASASCPASSDVKRRGLITSGWSLRNYFHPRFHCCIGGDRILCPLGRCTFIHSEYSQKARWCDIIGDLFPEIPGPQM